MVMPTESEIISQFEDSDIALTIVCFSFNHAAFISSAIQGFLIQKTKFRFEIICYDDCSTDDSRDIIQSYKDNYPSLFTLIFPDENHFSKGRNPFIDKVLPHLKGRYISCCEGDDFWVDPNKVQLQLEFLEANPDYVLATHDVASVDQNGTLVKGSCVSNYYKRDFSEVELKLGWAGPLTQALIYRNIYSSYPEEFHKVHLGDAFLAALLGEHGKSKYLDTIKPSYYRLHNGGVFSPLGTDDRHDVQSLTFFWMYKYYKRVNDLNAAHVYKMKSMEKLVRGIGFKDFVKLFLIRFFGINMTKLIKSKE